MARLYDDMNEALSEGVSSDPDDFNDTCADHAIDEMFDAFEEQLWAGDEKKKWPWIEELLEKTDVTRLVPTLLVGMLMMTLPVRFRIQARPSFVARVRAHLEATVQDRVDDILKNLE
jgi:hypothetical protein